MQYYNYSYVWKLIERSEKKIECPIYNEEVYVYVIKSGDFFLFFF